MRTSLMYLLAGVLLVFLFAATLAMTTDDPGDGGAPVERSLSDRVASGRMLVISHGCGDCHGGFDNPASENWLVGARSEEQIYQVGPFTTYARNLTPDDRTGLGRFSERQIFNALRYGLRPGETADVEITSSTPGEGNYPIMPKYLAVPMPWPVFRHMADQDIWDVAAYLKHGLQPVEHRVPDSEGPPDFWAEHYTTAGYGTYPVMAFPTQRERLAPE